MLSPLCTLSPIPHCLQLEEGRVERPGFTVSLPHCELSPIFLVFLIASSSEEDLDKWMIHRQPL